MDFQNEIIDSLLAEKQE
ncbi:Protein of unknown function [Bacillus mycoides]|nr:Protein of unknown function [Bacillus mycoides]SCM86941.1 Protein of unknown function [Bacillus mycoides]